MINYLYILKITETSEFKMDNFISFGINYKKSSEEFDYAGEEEFDRNLEVCI